MRIPPLSIWLEFPAPNYVDPVTRGPALIIVNAIFLTLVVVAITGRLYARLVVMKSFGVDDAMALLAFICTVALTTIVVLADRKFDWDRHIYDLPPNLIQGANIVAFVAKIIFTLAATFIRLSLICFYYRLVKDSGIKWFNWVLRASVAWMLIVCTVFIALSIWLCVPIQYYWLFPAPSDNYRCLSEGKTMLGAGVVTSVSDFWTTILPIPLVMRLQMPLRQRVGVCVLLCMGLVATIAGSLRTYFSWKSLLASWDETWYSYPLWICAAVEIDLGLICACAPAWKSLLQRPFSILSDKLSSKLSSLRSPSDKPSKTHGSSKSSKANIFQPLRSLHWFQHTRMAFERTERSVSDDDLELNFKGSASATDLVMNDQGTELQDGKGVNVTSHAMDNMARPATPTLTIIMRQSFDQCSTRLEDECTVSGSLEESESPRSDNVEAH